VLTSTEYHTSELLDATLSGSREWQQQMPQTPPAQVQTPKILLLHVNLSFSIHGQEHNVQLAHLEQSDKGS